jgi:hypothetical protein
VGLRLPKGRRVPAAFALLIVGTLAYDAEHASFWQGAHDTAPVAAVVLLVLLGLLMLRLRVAWWVFVIFSGVGLVTWVAHKMGRRWPSRRDRVRPAHVVADASLRPAPRTACANPELSEPELGESAYA